MSDQHKSGTLMQNQKPSIVNYPLESSMIQVLNNNMDLFHFRAKNVTPRSKLFEKICEFTNLCGNPLFTLCSIEGEDVVSHLDCRLKLTCSGFF